MITLKYISDFNSLSLVIENETDFKDILKRLNNTALCYLEVLSGASVLGLDLELKATKTKPSMKQVQKVKDKLNERLKELGVPLPFDVAVKDTLIRKCSVYTEETPGILDITLKGCDLPYLEISELAYLLFNVMPICDLFINIEDCNIGYIDKLVKGNINILDSNIGNIDLTDPVSIKVIDSVIGLTTENVYGSSTHDEYIDDVDYHKKRSNKFFVCTEIVFTDFNLMRSRSNTSPEIPNKVYPVDYRSIYTSGDIFIEASKSTVKINNICYNFTNIFKLNEFKCMLVNPYMDNAVLKIPKDFIQCDVQSTVETLKQLYIGKDGEEVSKF